MHRAQRGWSLAVVTALFVAPGGCAGSDGGAPAAADTGTVPVDTGALASDSASDARAETADVDHDGDGYPASVDCNDADAAVHPGATESCNGVDDNCNGLVDEPGAVGETTYYADADADGYGSLNVSRAACVQPSGFVSNASDCDDTNPEVSPVAIERCGNGLDDNCNGAIDEPGAEGSTTYYPDVDGDGYGGVSGAISTCTKPVGYLVTAADCDDDNPAVHPGATEWCNGIDDDCNGAIDEASAVDAQLYYQDKDGDGYGAAGTTQRACLPPTGYASGSDDCNDADAAIHPGATDLPDPADVDSNCDSIDGDLSRAILVSADAGNDANSGFGTYTAGALVAAPVRTLAKAVALAVAASPTRYVLVAGSASGAPLEYDAGPTGLNLGASSLYGGYVAATQWARTGTRASARVTSTGGPTISYGASLPTTIDRLTILGSNLSAPSAVAKPSIGLAILGSGLTVSDVSVIAGHGSTGAIGVDGASGAGCARCPGGAGGSHTGCGAAPTSGSSASRCPDASSKNGAGGTGSAGGSSACLCSCGGSGPPANGSGGATGGVGQPGLQGLGGYCSGVGCVSDARGTLGGAMLWSPTVPVAATDGGYGGGGGGGGGGGDWQWCCVLCGNPGEVRLDGGSGAPGGGGGCPGKAGAPGTSGGASIGILLATTTGVSFSKVDVVPGIGGDGGKGGNGGNGTDGAAGPSGSNGVEDTVKWGLFCAVTTYPASGHGGAGGAGGGGGGGGAGAGGDGGPSIGVALFPGLILPSGVAVDTKIVPAKSHGGAGGTGGSPGGGSTAGDPGQTGRSGLVVDVLAF
jgi:hypothetical protein